MVPFAAAREYGASASQSARGWLAVYAAVLWLGAGLACAFIAAGIPRPRIDDGFYKSVAAELVEHGRFAVPCASGLYPQADEIFACYPPLYPLTISAWYWVCGVSLRSSLAFTFTVHLLGVLAVMAITRRLLTDDLSGRAPGDTAVPSPGMCRTIVAAVGLIQLANVVYFDRVEETALLWIWLEVLAAHRLRARPGLLPAALSGLLLGLAALTSPWVGVLGALLVAGRALLTALPGAASHGAARWGGVALRLAVAAAVVLSLAGAWYAVIEAFYPGIMVRQFSIALHYTKKLQCSGTLPEKILDFAASVFHNPPQVPATMVALLYPLAVAARGLRRAAPLGPALYLATVPAMASLIVLRPGAYTYLGAAQMLLLPCLGPTVCRYLCEAAWPPWLGKSMLVGCTCLAYAHTAILGASAWCMPRDERPDCVYERLTSIIGPGEPVAATSMHWYAFQGRNPWRDACFSSLIDAREVLRCQWLVLPAELCEPDYIGGFEFVERVWTRSGWRTYAYALWRRRAEAARTTEAVSSVPPAAPHRP